MKHKIAVNEKRMDALVEEIEDLILCKECADTVEDYEYFENLIAIKEGKLHVLMKETEELKEMVEDV